MLLKQIYDARVAQPDVAMRLKEELDLEDTHRDNISNALLEGHAPEEILASYNAWNAFAGGAANLLTIIERSTEDVRAAASTTGADVPEIYAGIWPERSLNAQTLRTQFGGVILIDTGLLAALNVFLDAVARSLGHIFRDPQFGSDVSSQEQVANILDWLLIKCQAGIDVRFQSDSVLSSGPREQFRRQMNWAAVCYIVAHEAGHVANSRPWRGGWLDDNQLFQVGRGTPHPTNEVDVVSAGASENIADSIACRILRQPPLCTSDEPFLAQAFGAISVLALQNAIFWRRAAVTNDRLGWTHPYPEGRMYGLRLDLASPASQLAALEGAPEAAAAAAAQPETNMQRAVGAFIEWSQKILGTERYRQAALERGLGDRGLNPESLVMLYATDPSVRREPSDIVQGLRQTPNA
jgi:hypothetical protein